MSGHLVCTLVSGFHTVLEPAHLLSQGPLVNGVRRWHLNIIPDFTHLFHVGTLGVRPSVRVPHREGTDVEPDHFWSNGPLVNGVRSCQLVIKHDMTRQFHGPTLGVCHSVCIPHCFRTEPISGGRVHL